MTAHLNLRDGEAISEQMIQRMLALGMSIPFLAGAGIGTGYTSGAVGAKNGAAGADPNHFAIIADSSTMVLTARPGWAQIQKDFGGTSFDPRTLEAFSDAPLSATVTANATGSTRNDTVCLKIDQITAPNSDGSNLVTLSIVAGQSGGAVSNAPADGNLYFPLALVAVANGATNIAQGNVTDLRNGLPPRCVAVTNKAAPTGGPFFAGDTASDIGYLGTWLCTVSGSPGTWKLLDAGLLTGSVHRGTAVAITSGNVVPFDTIDDDPNNSFTTGAAAKFTAPIAGKYLINWGVRANASVSFVSQLVKSGVATLRSSSWSTNNVTVGSSREVLAAADYLQITVAINNITTNAAPPLDTFMTWQYIGP